jgi:surface-anchored protein
MAFSKPGTYTVSFDFSGNLAADGKETRSSEYQLVFEVQEE